MAITRITLLATLLLLGAAVSGCSFFSSGDEEPVQAETSTKTKDDKDVSDDDDAKSDEKEVGFFSGLFGGSKKAAVKPEMKSPPAADENQLKIARLWARVDELEEEQIRQKERLRVIEKGLTLGLVPEELKGKKKEAPPPPPPVPEVKAPEAQKVEPKPEAKGLSKEDADKYQAALASAHDNFRAGRYGRAAVEYSEINKNFGDLVDGGMAKYWVARCWMSLKEYNTARQHLAEFLKEHPGSPWMPRAKLELARVEWKLGLSETALQRFRDIIQQHPYEDAAEMAKMELENLDKTL